MGFIFFGRFTVWVCFVLQVTAQRIQISPSAVIEGNQPVSESDLTVRQPIQPNTPGNTPPGRPNPVPNIPSGQPSGIPQSNSEGPSPIITPGSQPNPVPIRPNPTPVPVSPPANPGSAPVPVNSPANPGSGPSNPILALLNPTTVSPNSGPVIINPAPTSPDTPGSGNPGSGQPIPMPQINQLSATTADFISGLSYQQLVSLFQIMILQQSMSGGGQGRPGIVPSVFPMGGGAGQGHGGGGAGGLGPNVDVNVHVEGYGQGAGAGGSNGTQSPLLQMTLFKGLQGPKLLKVAEEVQQSDLGKYVVGLHDYWKNAAENVRERYRNDVLKNIDSLNAIPKIKHAIQELLPGLALGKNPAGSL